jgi:hypothetical protein
LFQCNLLNRARQRRRLSRMIDEFFARVNDVILSLSLSHFVSFTSFIYYVPYNSRILQSAQLEDEISKGVRHFLNLFIHLYESINSKFVHFFSQIH